MPEAEIGWIAAIIVGGLAGWFAEMFMKSGTGILMNICSWHRWRSIGQLAVKSSGGRTRWMARLSDHGLHRSMHHYLPMARFSGTDRLGVILSLTGNRSPIAQLAAAAAKLTVSTFRRLGGTAYHSPLGP